MKRGVGKEKRDGSGGMISVDEWKVCLKVPKIDVTVEVIEAAGDVIGLHDKIVERMKKGMRPLCVLAKGEEEAAYVRAVRAEEMRWDLRCVIVGEKESAEKIEGSPIGEEGEREWKYEEGKWYVRRLKKVEFTRPVVASLALSTTSRGSLSNMSI